MSTTTLEVLEIGQVYTLAPQTIGGYDYRVDYGAGNFINVRILEGPDRTGQYKCSTRDSDGQFLGPGGGWSEESYNEMLLRPEQLEPRKDRFKTATKNPETFFRRFRQDCWKWLKAECAQFQHSEVPLQQKVAERFGIPFEWAKAFIFVLKAFRHPKTPNRAARADGDPIVLHSLQLYFSAVFLGIKNKRVLLALLVHDLLEDTTTTQAEIREALGDEAAELAWSLTEEDQNFSGLGLSPEDERRARKIRFVRKLQAGGKVVALAEILDRLDDICDLEYAKAKFRQEKNPDWLLRHLVAKFGKCLYFVCRALDNPTVSAGYDIFLKVLRDQIKEIEEESRIGISWDLVEQEMLAYKKLESAV